MFVPQNFFKMSKVGKKRAAANAKIDNEKHYSLAEAMALVKDVNVTKFDASVDLHVRLGWIQENQIKVFVEQLPSLMVPVKPKGYWYFVPG